MELSHLDPRAISLVTAIRQGDADGLERLLESEPELARAVIFDEKGHGRTLLHQATDWPGHFPRVGNTIAILIRAGADPNVPFRSSPTERFPPETPLHWAASSNDVEALDALLDGGAGIEAPGAIFTGGTAMSDAVIFAQWNAARRLLERGARTTFSQAAGLGLLDRVKACFEGAEPAQQDITHSLWHACRGGSLPVAKFLVDRGGDAHWVGWDQLTPLDCAERSGNAELIAWLRGLGARKAKELKA